MKHLLALAAATLLAACAVTPPKGDFVSFQQVAAETKGLPYECAEYDAATDSCEGLSRWKIKSNKVTATTEVAFNADGPLRMTMISSHNIVDGKVCGMNGTPKVLLNGKSYKRGTNPFVDFMTGAMTGIMSDICAGYYRSGDGYYTEATGPDGKVIRDFSSRSRFFAEKKAVRAASLE